jgi:hypothetical protein
MGENMKLWILISILFLINPVSANVLEPATQAGADMINGGLNAWLDSQSNSIISFADGETNSTRSPGQMALFHMITFDYSPFDNPGVLSTIQSTAIIFLFLFVIFVFAGMAYIMVHSRFPGIGQAVDYTIFQDKGFDYMEYLKTLGTVIIFIVFGFTAVWTVMLISKTISEMMTAAALDALVSSSSSGVVYLFMAFAYMLLSVFMAIRILGISIITSLLLVLFAAWQFHQIRDLVNMVFVYLGILIFMQPILISIAAIGIMSIEWIGNFTVGYFSVSLLYFGLIIMLVVVAFCLIIGPALFGKLIKIGSRALL